ncbi:hypothetical protein [Sphingobacterium prati]|uniref:hypothetical protein n=1 Tax=Sphingobacterium prati TaxID=2737006 RepID=UPI001553270D|nr:hypothetical protein [Sphingobacterium prati]NPE46269.1 hypothetical protein [Sphingobacterium prati]
MKRPYLITLSLLLLSSFYIIANGQQSKNSSTKIDSNEFKNSITPPYNLFYLSKYLNKITLNPTENDLIYSSLVNLVGKDKLDIVKEGEKYGSIYRFKTSSINAKTDFVRRLLESKQHENKNKDLQSLSKLQKNKDLDSLLKQQIAYNENDRQITETKNNISLLSSRQRELKIALDSLKVFKGGDSKDSIDLINKYKNLLDHQEADIYSLELLNQKLMRKDASINNEILKANLKIDANSTLIKGISSKMDSLIKNIAEKYLSDGTLSANIKNYLEGNQRSRQESLQINLTTSTQNAQQSLNYTGLSIPSQSQMIDAMAMFLAKRAKQEAAIWFMDQLRKRVNNPLIYDVFPATIELLDGLSDYRTANFGTSWRYAISKDFVEMPRNVSKSSWTKQFLTTENAANLETAVEMGYNIDGLIKARYNYRDIIRQLYLNPTYSPDPNISVNNTRGINKHAQNIIALLYIATNELFTITDKNNYRLLTYEELKTLDTEQWKIFIELLDLKYGNVFDNLPGIKNAIKNKDKVIAWLSPLLLSLGQFDKINLEQQALIEKNKSDQMNQSLSNTWSILGQVIANFENYPFGISEKQGVNNYLANIKNVFDIIENIQEKNFVAAAQNTLGLVDSYYKIGFSQNPIDITALKSFSLKKHPENKYELDYDANNTQLTIKINDNSTPIEKEDLEYIKYLGTNLQRLDENDRSGFITTSKETIKGKEVLTKLERLDSLNNKDLIYLINRIAIFKIISETNKPIQQTAALNLFSASIPQLNTLASALPKLSGMSYANELIKLSGFFGDVIASSSSAELANVIESHALPPTSYKLKRKMSSSVDLNAYVGAFAGRIVPIGNSSLNCKWTGGITAPIGVTIRPAGNFFKYFNFNVQLLELGNLVNHYLITPDSAYNKEVHFSEVFSPGANILYNIKNTPFVAFIGGKLLPLKAYYDEGLKKRFNDKAFDAAIFSIGLKIDIPLVNLHSGE